MAQMERRQIFSDTAEMGLCLHPPGCCPEGATCSTARATQLCSTAASTTSEAPPEGQMMRKPLTVVYGDRAYTVDVTEAQAREILRTAHRGAEQGGGDRDREGRNADRPAPAAGSAAAEVSACPLGPSLGQSMKGSLRRFLEKRTARREHVAGSPYSTLAMLHSSR